MSHTLDRLHAAVLASRSLDPSSSRTARLLASGPKKMAQKVIEEAAEVGIEAVAGDREAVVLESADLLYNLAVLWAAAGITPREVLDELARRERLFGMAEKLPKAKERVGA